MRILAALFVCSYAAEKGQYFFVDSFMDVKYESGLSKEDLRSQLLDLNPILDRLHGLEWTRGVDSDFSKFDGISYTPSDEIYSIKFSKFTFSTWGPGQDGMSGGYNYEIQIFLNKEEEGTDRCFKTDMEVIYSNEHAIKYAFKDDIIRPVETSIKWEYTGRTEVDIHLMEDGEWVLSGECFRTDKAVGYCRCEVNSRPNVTLDYEGKCVKTNEKSTVSCEFADDITGPGEEGLMECPEGHEIRISAYSPKLVRWDETTCSAAKTDEKFILKKYRVCDTSHTVYDYIQNKCNGKQTCQYKFYDGETPTLAADFKGNKRYKAACKGLRRYVHVPYGCNKLKVIGPEPTPEPEDPCASCAESGFTKEVDCHFVGIPNQYATQHIPVLHPEGASSYAQCAALCNADSRCKAFTYFDTTGTINCHLMTGLLNKKCGDGGFTFSRKCELSPQCSSDQGHCAESRIPFFVYGPQKWTCDTSGGIKTCRLSCEDGFNQGVIAFCGDDNEWNLESSENSSHLPLGEFHPGCQVCSGDPSSLEDLNIAAGGTWECDISDPKKKTCLPKCPTPKALKGGIECSREHSGYDLENANSTLYTPNKQLANQFRRHDNYLTCFWPTCEESDFAGLLAEETGNFEVSDFFIRPTGSGFIAPLYCDDQKKKKSKSKCSCRARNGKRRFVCKHLDLLKGC